MILLMFWQMNTEQYHFKSKADKLTLDSEIFRKQKTQFMTTPIALSTAAYQHIGYIFYAVASADKWIDEREIDTLKDLVQEVWLDLDSTNDNFGSDAAYQIEIVFDWLKEAEWDSDTCFSKFEDYYKSHPCYFSKNVKSLIVKTSLAIAESYAGKNKSELIILAKIESLLKS